MKKDKLMGWLGILGWLVFVVLWLMGFLDMSTVVFCYVLVPLICTTSLVQLALLKFPKWGLLDRPQKYGLKRAPISYYGGLVIMLVFLLEWVVIGGVFNNAVLLLFLSMVVGLISFADDKWGLHPLWRLLLQVLVGAALFAAGIAVRAWPNPVGPEILLNFWLPGGVAVISLLITILWVILVMNTVNWLDGVSGLVSGVTGIAFLTFVAINYQWSAGLWQQSTVFYLSTILATIMLSFWRYDFPPARILMGDTGTMFVGFLLAALSIYDHGQLATAFLVLGLPILDAVWVVTRRILTGRAPWRGDLDHFHHRLLRAGLSERQTVGVICLISAVFGVLAVILHSGAKVWVGIGLLALVTTLAFSVVMLDIEKQRKKV